MIWLILLFALILRVINLNQGLWLDEAISALAARDYSYIGIVRDFLPGDTHPPLYYLSLKFCTEFFGFSEISLRSLSVVFGVMTVYVVYLIGRKVKNKKLGIIASLFFATAPLHIYYSQEVRMYALSALAVSLSVYGYLFVLKKAKTKNWILFSLSLLFIGLVDYLPLLILPVFWVYACLKKKGKSWWRGFLLSHLPLLAFLVVWFPIFYKQTLGSRAALISFPAWGELLGKANLKELSLVWIKFIIGRIPIEQNFVFGLLITFVSIPFVYALFRGFKQRRNAGIFWLWLILPLAISFLGSFFVPGFSFFRLLFVLPAFYLLITYGVSKSKFARPLIIVILGLNLIFSSVYIFNQKHRREDWRGAVNFVEERAREDLAVLMAFPEPFAPYRWYSKNTQIAHGVRGFGDSKGQVASRLEKAVGKQQNIYTFDYLMDVSDPQRYVYQGLEDFGFFQKEVYNFRGIGQVRLWER